MSKKQQRDSFEVCMWDVEEGIWTTIEKKPSLSAAIRAHDALIASGDAEPEDVAVFYEGKSIQWSRRQDGK